MIVAPDFIWLHFPKCAGTETEAILRKHFGNRQDLEFDPQTPEWHDNLRERQARDRSFQPGNRKLVVNFRRLPSWYASRCRSSLIQNPSLVVGNEMVRQGQFYEFDGRIATPDDYLEKFVRLNRPDHIIRSEFLEEDLIKIFSTFLDTSQISGTDFEHRNHSIMLEPPIPMPEVQNLYTRNPLWCKFECKVYGMTLCDY